MRKNIFGEFISIDEFLEGTGISIDNHIFEDQGTPCQDDWRFWIFEYEDEPPEYYFDNGKGIVREFKYMKDYGEIWMRMRHKDEHNLPQWSLWNTWKVVD